MGGLLELLEDYYDAVPRGTARAEDFGPLTLFVREGEGWPYYARPARSWRGPVTAADVRRVRDRQRELGVPESFEWVAETTPALRAAVTEAGLTVCEHPLMALDPAAGTEGTDGLPEGLSVRVVGPGDPALPSAVAVPNVAFSEPGPAVGGAGPAELAATVRKLSADGSVDRLAARVEAGLTVLAAAVRDGTALCAGQHQPVGDVTELVGIGTLPTARRQGLGLAVTAALVADARSRGVRTVFLSAGDEVTGRVYGRAGFRRVGTALIAGPG
ncbi:acetyltransferase [Streptomyces eurocidicus]|uniref:Acetyltransferase n=1 Tax=Streptomyces eurocidicus TaxID=66423 RepID=A0A2N8NQ80_STREU|nr:GNAT family N-acetyltransferase [Streptomyces eurocidicus]MBB5121916.1 N-acetylglutamate synthase-like GNAT family acetyltransferase [Streptomyces eurocidicus]MBF6051571.1 GNAT family N-acetyltransferase [Streptomyces eurocidicus]PNE30919.1 acetyltransferase [Streptomyces eurocidicus]